MSTLAYDGLTRPELRELHRQVQQRVPLVIGESEDAVELADKRVFGGKESDGQASATWHPSETVQILRRRCLS